MTRDRYMASVLWGRGAHPPVGGEHRNVRLTPLEREPRPKIHPTPTGVSEGVILGVWGPAWQESPSAPLLVSAPHSRGESRGSLRGPCGSLPECQTYENVLRLVYVDNITVLIKTVT